MYLMRLGRCMRFMYVYDSSVEQSYASWRAAFYFILRIRNEKTQKSPMWPHTHQGPPTALAGDRGPCSHRPAK